MGDQLVSRLIIAGSRTRRTPNTIIGPRDIFFPLAESVTGTEFKTTWAQSFFNHDADGKAAAEAPWNRIFSRIHDRAPHLGPELAKRQRQAFGKFTKSHQLNPYGRIRELSVPTFVANGDNDLWSQRKTALS
jgi:hypothetical protein